MLENGSDAMITDNLDLRVNQKFSDGKKVAALLFCLLVLVLVSVLLGVWATGLL